MSADKRSRVRWGGAFDVRDDIKFVLSNVPAIMFAAAFFFAAITKSPREFSARLLDWLLLTRHRLLVGRFLPHRIPAYRGGQHRLAGKSVPVRDRRR